MENLYDHVFSFMTYLQPPTRAGMVVIIVIIFNSNRSQGYYPMEVNTSANHLII